MSQDLIRRLEQLNAKFADVYRFAQEANSVGHDEVIGELAYIGLHSQYIKLANDAKKEAAPQAAPAAA